MRKISLNLEDQEYIEMIESINFLNNDPKRKGPKWTISDYVRFCISIDVNKNYNYYLHNLPKDQ